MKKRQLVSNKKSPHEVEKLREIKLKGKIKRENLPNNIKFPNKLRDLEDLPSDCLLKIQKVKIKEEPYPYNASILEYDEDSYLLFFRTDSHHKKETTTGIGFIRLNQDFQQITPCRYINTRSNYSEDPRIFYHQDRLMIIYNDLVSRIPNCRTIHLAEVSNLEPNLLDDNIPNQHVANQAVPNQAVPNQHRKSKNKINTNKHPIINDDIQLEYISNLDQHITSVEKNWSPFIYQNQIYLQYYMNPHKILGLPGPRQPKIEHLIHHTHLVQDLSFWKWGELRGGTPARLINSEYLAFFHSSFVCQKYNFYWYVMAAYTFESHPPFRITKISPHPIMFPKMYHSQTNPYLSPNKRIIYPTGFAIRTNLLKNQKKPQTLIHLSCGENDSTIKILTFDYDKLIKTLIPLPIKSKKKPQKTPQKTTSNRSH